MCNVLLRDPANKLWQVGISNLGSLNTSPSAITSPTPTNPILDSGLNFWRLAASINGSINATKVTPVSPQRILSYVPMTSPGGVNFQLVVHKSGVIGVNSTGGLLPDFIPYTLDVSMSRFPVSDGIFCTTCGNASVTVSADLSCWCCACSAFVLPEDTNIVVQLSE